MIGFDEISPFFYLLYLFVGGCGDTPKETPAPKTEESRSQGAALVLLVEGKVSVIEKQGAKATPAELNQFLDPDGKVLTGPDSQVLLLLTNGTTLSVGPDTTLELKTFDQKQFDPQNEKVSSLEEESSASTVLLDLKAGDLVVDVKKLKKKSNLEISTALGVAGIRGTSFKLLASAESTTLSVLSGRVEFVSPSKENFQVDADQEIVVPKGLKPKIKTLPVEERKAIGEAIEKAREKANPIELSTLSEQVSKKEETQTEVPEGWTGQDHWLVEKDGTLFLNPGEGSDTKSFKDDLWTAQAYDDFELSLEYTYQPGDQTAVIFRAANKEKPVNYYRIPIGDSEDQGGLSWIVKPAVQATKGPNQWNQLFVSAKGQKIRIELNGRKVVDIEVRPHPRRSINHLSNADNQRIPRQNRSLKGWLAIANEGDPMSFRKLSITQFKNGVATTRVVPSASNLPMIWVDPGTFVLGSPPSEPGHKKSEIEHNVTLTKGFYLGKYEVTQGQYEVVTGQNPSVFKADGTRTMPVENLTMDEAINFCKKLTELEKNAGLLKDGWFFGLPSEAEWEYACRAGVSTAYSWGNEMDDSKGNFKSGGGGSTCSVGQYAPNAWGFHDMHGNALERVSNRYSATFYSNSPSRGKDPWGPTGGRSWVARGGDWNSDPLALRASYRKKIGRDTKNNTLGFRLMLKNSGK